MSSTIRESHYIILANFYLYSTLRKKFLISVK